MKTQLKMLKSANKTTLPVDVCNIVTVALPIVIRLFHRIWLKSTLRTVLMNIPERISSSDSFALYLIVENLHNRYDQIAAKITEIHIIRNPAATDKINIITVNIPKNPQFLGM